MDDRDSEEGHVGPLTSSFGFRLFDKVHAASMHTRMRAGYRRPGQ